MRTFAAHAVSTASILVFTLHTSTSAVYAQNPFAAPGEVDGSPGVHVGATGDVLVSAFTVEGARTRFMK
jgi:hypothetical protein